MSNLAPNLPAETIEAIIAERQRQDQKWKIKGLKQSVWMDVLAEEIGEVARARVEQKDVASLQAELIQVAAVAVAIIEDCLGVGQSDALNFVDGRSGGYTYSEKWFLRMLYWQGRAAEAAESLSPGGECSGYISNIANIGAIAATVYARLGGAG